MSDEVSDQDVLETISFLVWIIGKILTWVGKHQKGDEEGKLGTVQKRGIVTSSGGFYACLIAAHLIKK